MTFKLKALALATIVVAASQAHAANFTVSLTGDTSNFTTSQFYFNNAYYQESSLPLSGLDSTNAFTVSMGDTIASTVTLNTAYTIPASQQHTDFLQFFSGSSFPHEDTGVTGTFTFFDGGSEVASYGYSSSTSGQLASYAALFPPNNGALTFDSFTNDVTITKLATPATLDGSSLEYALVSSAPEPASWALMLTGFGMMGAMARRRNARAAI